MTVSETDRDDLVRRLNQGLHEVLADDPLDPKWTEFKNAFITTRCVMGETLKIERLTEFVEIIEERVAMKRLVESAYD